MDPTVAQKIFEALYDEVKGYDLSFSARKKLPYYDRGFTYGEIVPKEFYEILKEAAPQKGEVFYDLGSGTGKAVIAAALLFPFSKTVGVEYLDDLYHASLHTLERLKKEMLPQDTALAQVQFFQKDFTDFDFSDADIVFAHATCFHDGQLKKLTPKFEKLKKGSRLLIVSKEINSVFYRKKKSSEHPFSWGKATLHSYEKIV